MTPEELKLIVEETIQQKQFDNFWYILIAAIISLLIALLIEYFKTRTRNYATKQDIEDLTRKVEEVKIEYAKQMEVFKNQFILKNQKILDLDKKLVELQRSIIYYNNAPKIDKLQTVLNNIGEVNLTISTSVIFQDLLNLSISLENEQHSVTKKYEDAQRLNSKKVNIDTSNFTLLSNNLQKELLKLQKKS